MKKNKRKKMKCKSLSSHKELLAHTKNNFLLILLNEHQIGTIYINEPIFRRRKNTRIETIYQAAANFLLSTYVMQTFYLDKLFIANFLLI